MSSTVRPRVASAINQIRNGTAVNVAVWTTGLGVECNDFLNDAEMEGLLEVFEANTTVGGLHFGRIRFHSALSATERIFFSTILSTHPSLTRVELNDCMLEGEQVIGMTQALNANKSLKSFLIWRSYIGYTGFLALLQNLHENKTLENLSLQSSQIVVEEDGVRELSASLEKLSLKRLDL